MIVQRLLDAQFCNELAAGNIDPKSCIKTKNNALLQSVHKSLVGLFCNINTV